MILHSTGNILECDTDAVVNTVNCVGVMGKGLALQFKNAYPRMFLDYKEACRNDLVVPGKMHVYYTASSPKYIVNFPTKRHWVDNSRIDDIIDGLIDLLGWTRFTEIKSIAIPRLGCNNGNLEWSVVRPMIEETFKDETELLVNIISPRE